MTELTEFKEFIKDKSANTIKSYNQKYTKLKKIINKEKEQNKDNQKNSGGKE